MSVLDLFSTDGIKGNLPLNITSPVESHAFGESDIHEKFGV